MAGVVRAKVLVRLGGVAAAVVLAVAVVRGANERCAAPDTGREAEVPARAVQHAPASDVRQSLPPAATKATPSLPADSAADAPETDADEAPEGAVSVVYPVDLDALRARLPDNLYWQLGAPTDDPALLARRAAIEESNNKLFGEVQSGSASPEEIERYYDQRRRVSEDYIEFAALLLSEHGKDLPEQDRGLYELSIRMHRSRLDDEPRLRREALARYQVAEQRRAEHRRKERAN